MVLESIGSRCALAERNRTGVPESVREGPRAILRREVHAALGVLEARVENSAAKPSRQKLMVEWGLAARDLSLVIALRNSPATKRWLHGYNPAMPDGGRREKGQRHNAPTNGP
jgi:hypothetical protein